MKRTISIPDEASMLDFGQRMAQALLCQSEAQENLNSVIFLQGSLGAGKTTLVRGFLRGFGYQDKVKSPTYTLVESYLFGAYAVFHFDLYRLHHSQELESIGIQDYFIPSAICLIEWPEHGKGLLPTPDLSCYISLHDNSREIKLIAQSAHGETLLQRLWHDQ